MVVARRTLAEQGRALYHPPEAQLDRFLFKITVTYPTQEQESRIVANHHQLGPNSMAEQVVNRINTAAN